MNGIIIHSNKKNYPSDSDDLKYIIHQKLYCSTCKNHIGKEAEIWSCKSCYSCFH